MRQRMEVAILIRIASCSYGIWTIVKGFDFNLNFSDLLKFAEQLASQENPKNGKYHYDFPFIVHFIVNKEINVHADEEETVVSALKKAESKKKDESKSNDAFNKRPKDEDMDLD